MIEESKSRGTARLVLIAIHSLSDAPGEQVSARVADLARLASVSTRTARRALRDLQDLGEIEVTPRGGETPVDESIPDVDLEFARPNAYRVIV
jgi:Mn-dependent DtxR family transcriptional regulator